MSDVQGHMLRHYQLFNSQLGVGLPQGITHPKPLGWETKEPALSLGKWQHLNVELQDSLPLHRNLALEEGRWSHKLYDEPFPTLHWCEKQYCALLGIAIFSQSAKEPTGL